MKKSLILYILILIILLTLALNTGFVKKIKAGNVAGIIVCEGNPVTDAWVSVSGNKVKTDSNGKFFISDIPSGAYIVAVTGDKCIFESFFKPALVWSDSTTILIFSLDTIPRPALNFKVKVTMEIDSITFVKMGYKHIMELALSSPKKEVVPDSAKKIIIDGDTVIVVPGPPYPGQVVEPQTKQMISPSATEIKTGNMAGVVLDANTAEPLHGASLSLEEMPEIYIKADVLGRFWFSSIPIGEYELWAAMIGFRRVKISNLKVAEDSTSMVVFRLNPAPIGKQARPLLYQWRENKVKCDSTEFFEKYYKILLRKSTPSPPESFRIKGNL